MPQTPPGEDLAADPAWTGAARFLEGRVPPGMRVVAPDAFAPILGASSDPDPAILPDWAVVPARGGPPAAFIRRLLAETTPVFANDGYVVFARRPTFGLADMRNAAPVRALAERAASEPPQPAAAPTPATAPASPPPPAPSYNEASPPRAIRLPEAAMAPILPIRSPDIPRATLPPEARALQVPSRSPEPPPAIRAVPPPLPTAAAPVILPRSLPPEAIRPIVAEAPRAAAPIVPPPVPEPPRPVPAAMPEPQAPSPAATSGTPWGTLPARVTTLLGDCAGRRVGIGGDADGLARASLPPSALRSDLATALPDGVLDAALLHPDQASLADQLAEAARALRPGGLALVVAENAESLGRRLAEALGRPAAPPGLSAAAIRGAMHAIGLIPLRLDGHSLDTWRATADAAPPGLTSSDPAAALLDEAGEAAGPRHAAWILLLARKP
ncbi:hypothetical protein [Roseomonas sp. WA12]